MKRGVGSSLICISTSPSDSVVMEVSVQGQKIFVRVSENCGHSPGTKKAVLLLHGFPDSSSMWDSQASALSAAGYHVIAPDMLGYARSDKPAAVHCYTLKNVCSLLCSLLDKLGVQQACVVGHDWGAATAWAMALQHPDRVSKLVVLSVGHPGVGAVTEPRQRAHWWYMLFFLLPDAEVALRANDWALFRQTAGLGCTEQQTQQYIQQLSQPGALTAALNWYRANTRASHFGQTRQWPVTPATTVKCPVLGVWSTQDTALLEPQMAGSAQYVAAGKWHYVRMEGVGHWIARDAPHQLNELLLSFLGQDDSSAGMIVSKM